MQSAEELYARVAQSVASDRVETLTMTGATQRRSVLEAVAYGTFMREVEDWIDNEYQLLTELPPPQLPPLPGPGGGGRALM